MIATTVGWRAFRRLKDDDVGVWLSTLRGFFFAGCVVLGLVIVGVVMCCVCLVRKKRAKKEKAAVEAKLSSTHEEFAGMPQDGPNGTPKVIISTPASTLRPSEFPIPAVVSKVTEAPAAVT